MERCKINIPENVGDPFEYNFMVDSILPLFISKENDNYCIVFRLDEDCREKKIYINLPLYLDSKEEAEYLEQSSIYVENIMKSKDKVDNLTELMEGFTPAEILYCDFNMVKNKDKKSFYNVDAYNATKDKLYIYHLFITRDSYIKLSIFFNNLKSRISNADLVFLDPKINNIEFINIDHIKLNGSIQFNTTTGFSNTIFNYYTCGQGPTEFKFILVSPALENSTRKLRNPLPKEFAEIYTRDSFIINDIIYDNSEDNIIVLYYEKSKITGKHSHTYALVMNKDIYNKTNLVDIYKNYEEERTQ